MQKKLIIPGLALALALAGGWAFMPASKTLSPADYAAWLHNPENELRCSASAGQIELTALYKPLESIVLQEADAKTLASSEAIAERKRALADLQYYEVRLANPLSSDPTFQQYLGTLQQDIALVDGGDSLACVLFHHEPSMGVKPHETLLLGFSRTSNTNDKTLLIDLSQLGQGVAALNFSASALANLPKLSML